MIPALALAFPTGDLYRYFLLRAVARKRATLAREDGEILE